MKLLRRFGTDSLRWKTMGVSKPCCRACADFLEKEGVDYSYWHNQNVGHWYRPY
ncbi:hypothetical protein [Paraburkholderia guartelaensis]|uniref:hypothetical protein n=1 Tax=Paraburkholderia guartelaensis TaxID=2546446 RepID=UPI0038BB33D1